MDISRLQLCGALALKLPLDDVLPETNVVLRAAASGPLCDHTPPCMPIYCTRPPTSTESHPGFTWNAPGAPEQSHGHLLQLVWPPPQEVCEHVHAHTAAEALELSSNTMWLPSYNAIRDGG